MTTPAPRPTAGVWTLEIEGTPPSVNRLLSSHWAKARKLKQAMYWLVVSARLRGAVPAATGRRRVSMVVTVVNRSHAPDPDNLWKATLDACVKAELLIDDAAEWCELGGIEIRKGDRKGTVITLQDLD